jgi:phosphomevalonate kinase
MPLISASAPGKVLICGGYLVVEAPHVGISIGVNAMFTTEVVAVSPAAPAGVTLPDGAICFSVESPQFGATFNFIVTGDATNGVSVAQPEGERASPFLFNAVLTVCAHALGVAGKQNVAELLPEGARAVSLRLLAGNDFYSQRNYIESKGEKVSVSSLRAVPPHNPLVGAVSKTGLGSSAALTTSVVAALVCYLEKIRPPQAEGVNLRDVDQEVVHRLAQVAHSVAQGKIGSGFDVYTAAYGTCAYTRFPALRVEGVMKGSAKLTTLLPATILETIAPSVEWVPKAVIPGGGRFTMLPRNVNLMLADIHEGGSETPGMVAKVMAWRKALPQSTADATNLWDALAANNADFIRALIDLLDEAEEDPVAYSAGLKLAAAAPSAQWAEIAAAGDATKPGAQHTLALFEKARACAAGCRQKLRAVGEGAGVEIEPPKLTPLLDATLRMPGVLAAACPGAGGYDAIFALVIGKEEECRAVESFWESYTDLSVCPLLVREAGSGLVVRMGSA